MGCRYASVLARSSGSVYGTGWAMMADSLSLAGDDDDDWGILTSHILHRGRKCS